ncbi:MAG: PorV/PorQ family protein [Phocaeicola sp.]
MMRIYLIIVVSFIATLSSAQMPQLHLSSDPISLSMGSTGNISSASAYSIYSNSSAVAFSDNKGDLGLSYMAWQPDGINVSIASFSGYINSVGRFSFLLGTQYGYYQEYAIIDENNVLNGTFRPFDLSVTFGVAYRIADNWAAGVNMRYINSKVYQESASAIGVDLHLMYQKEKLTAGITFNNVGSELDYGWKDRLAQPMKINAAADYKLFNESTIHGVRLAGELGYLISPTSQQSLMAGLGAEYSYKKFVAARVGYRYGDEEKYISPFITLGLGIQWANFKLDGAYLMPTVSHSPIKNSFVVALSYTLN